MADLLPEKPPKKVRVHSLESFWWHVFKKSFKNAREPFENFGTLCAIFAGIIAAAYLTNQVTQEWGDYMIYWSIAVPVAVWCVLFLWNLIKIPHKTYKEDMGAASSGATLVPVKEIASRNFGHLFFVVIIVSAFVCLLSVKNYQIEKLKSQISPPINSKSSIATKPLPVKIIPNPEPPPIISTQQLAVVETQKHFEIFNTGTNDVDDAVSVLAKMKSEDKAQKEAQEKSTNEAMKQWWTNSLPYFNYELISLRDILVKETAKHGDGIAQSVGYFQCLPLTISPEIIERKLGEIGFQKNTNVVFFIEIIGSGDPAQKLLRIKCSSGLMDININIFQGQMSRTIQLPQLPDFLNVTRYAPLDQAHNFIDEGLKLIIGNQEGYLNPMK